MAASTASFCGKVAAAFAPLAILPVQPAHAQPPEILAAEEAAIADICTRYTLLDGFITDVDVDGNNLEDYLVQYAAVECDGSASAFCGTGGCTFSLYLGRPEGGFDFHGDLLGHEVTFDLPLEASFTVLSHGSACDRPGFEPCVLRYRIEDGELLLIGPE